MPSHFIPAARFSIFTKLYDPFNQLLFNPAFDKIVKTIPFKNHERVLDLACGPGNLLLKIHQTHPEMELTGVDIDPEILKIAKKKTQNQNNINLIEADACQLPFPDETFDICISTLALHHLKPSEKETAFKEVYRCLKKGGTFFLFDFAKPTNTFGRYFAKIYRYFEAIDEAVEDLIPKLYAKTDFRNIKTHWSYYGIFSLISGEK